MSDGSVRADGERPADAQDGAARATRRYLDLLRDALLDQHYLENELRIDTLLGAALGGGRVELEKLANPSRYMSVAMRKLRRQRHAGDQAEAGGLAYAGIGRIRLDHLRECLETIRADAVPGDFVESGTGRGGAAIFMRGFLEAHELPERRVWVADRFDGAGSKFPVDLNSVRDAFARFELLDDRVTFLQGAPAGALAEASIDEIALLRVDSHDPEEIRTLLETLHPRLAPGGFVVVDTHGDALCQAAVGEFRSAADVAEPLERVDWSAVAWRKSVATARNGVVRAPRKTATKDLGVVVVAHNMRREAARTLHSLSRAYQQGIESLDYEVLVVENGSHEEEKLGEELVQSFGPEFRYIDLGEESAPSPARAVNRGIAASTGRAIVVMIDGAHVLTPGVLRLGMLGMSTYAPAVVTVKQWYVGPGQQPQTVAAGYDKELEDRLFEQIRWPSDGYRLFEVGHFIGDRDWFDGEWESNCLFVPRELIEQAGAMDESFSTPGGGFVNLDFFERMVGTPGVTQVSLLGEGSFHQVHGGTTTNTTDPGELIRSYDEQYEELRGRRFQVPPPNVHYIGSLPPSARRTRPRRMSSFRHFSDAARKVSARRPARPTPVPQNLRADFIEAFWRSGAWHQTPWLGKSTHRPPTDLFLYQELIHRLQPDWVIETRTSVGGRALFLASICELMYNGHVISIDKHELAGRPEHARITYVQGDPAAPATAAEVRRIVGEDPRALLILGGGAAPQVLAAFENLSPLVPVGSYVVVEDTILEGNPVWPHFGPGPAAAVQQAVSDGKFVPDHSFERFALGFNVGGFLKRVR